MTDDPHPQPGPDLLADLGVGVSLPFLDELYQRFRIDPAAVDASWRPLLERMQRLEPPPAAPGAATNGRPPLGANGRGAPAPLGAFAGATPATGPRLDRVYAIINAYRARGHLEARLDPLEQKPVPPHPDLDPAHYGFTAADLDALVTLAPPVTLYGVEGAVPLREIIARLRETYCRSIGVQMMHISDPTRRAWLEERMEPSLNRPSLERAAQLRILDKLGAAEAFERFIHTRWVGAKRFGLDGAETLIPLVDQVLECAGGHGVDEAVIGMAHRGRLNVLANIIGKSAGEIFTEFEDIDPESTLGGGDVKYHLGYSADHVTAGGHRIHLSLAFNPSHLEAVDPVVIGRVRAKQSRRNDTAKARVLGVLIHGDAAFAGQGLVPETLQLSQLPGYRTGGTVHVVVNNQIGFTTNPTDSRSTWYCTDVARMLECPIFHVNGEDAEAVAHVTRLAMEYRREFACDVVIDMLCFRRYGHNESDEPSFTQPLLYRKIEQHPAMRLIYGRQLVERGVLTQAEVDRMLPDRLGAYEAEYARAKSAQARPVVSSGVGVWRGYQGGPEAAVPDVDTGVPRERLQAITQALSTVPPGFHPHPKIARLMGERAAQGRGERPVEWNLGELLAFGSLMWDGTVVRLSGQDVRRGTFSSRHAVLTDVESGGEYCALKHLHPGQGRFRLFDSPLSEAGVLGFEFGYSLDYPDSLVIWEAQFGDFVNGAQVILDQFVSSSEDKWRRISGLTMFLPHGYEGQGPEHSSARFERFLQLAAEDNIQVCQPTTAAQLFHLLRRQVLRPWRKPLIVLTPKSLLRGAKAASPLAAFEGGRFERLVVDDGGDAARIERVLFCTGKVCYDLLDERNKRAAADVAVVRVEQLYPLRDDDLAAVLARFPKVRSITWVQDEPENMGGLQFMLPYLWRAFGKPARTAARVASASPATGSAKAHAIEQRRLLDAAFAQD